MKPTNSYGGKKIHLVNNVSDIPSNENWVVSDYITDVLQYKGHKLDIRVMLAITSIDPLVVYIHRASFVKMARDKYELPTEQNRYNSTIHLTNVHLNYVNYDQTQLPEGDNAFISWHEFIDRMNANISHFNFAKSFILETEGDAKQIELVLKRKIETTMRKTMARIYPDLLSAARTETQSFYDIPRKYFAFLGFDIIASPDGNIQVLEGNMNTAFTNRFNLDPVQKENDLWVDIYNLLGVRLNIEPDARIGVPAERRKPHVVSPRYGVTADEKVWRFTGQSELPTDRTTSPDCEGEPCLSFASLSAVQRRQLLQVLDEQTRLGEFRRLRFEEHPEEFASTSTLNKALHDFLCAHLQ